MEAILRYHVCASVLCFSSCSVWLAGTCFVDSTITPPFLCEVHFVTAHLDEKRISGISKSNKWIPTSGFLTVESCFCFNSESTMTFSASKHANEVAQRTEEPVPTATGQRLPRSRTACMLRAASTANLSTLPAHSSLLAHSPSCAQTSWIRSARRTPTTGLTSRTSWRTFKKSWRSGPSSTIVAALCIISTSKFADDKLSGEVVEDMLKKSFGEHQDSDSRVSLTAVSSSSRFKAWCAAAGFDITGVTNQDTAD